LPTEHESNLPIQLTAFVGREHELADVKRLLAIDRLITLTGAGGVGKTRLALQTAADVIDDYSDGVWFAGLASLADASLLAQTVAAMLGVGQMPGQQPAQTLAHFLSHKRLLLLLDNCEHLIDACAELVDYVLRTCPHVRILATSRQRLGVAGEIAWRVPSLASPHPSAAGTDEIAAYSAVQLFVDRARSLVKTFALGDTNASAVAQICQRLDGIPLAIELAASRVLVLAPEQILARLDDRFRLLVGGSRTAPTRQQTLRATLEWSHSLLSEPERALFRRLSVFVGGFTLEAAEAVCAGKGIAERDVLDLLAALVDKSLVWTDASDPLTLRYGLLETLRQYAVERLMEAAEIDTVLCQHAQQCLEVAEEAEPHLLLASQRPWLDKLEHDLGNFRAALRWSIDVGDADTGVRLAGALYRVWFLRGYVREGRRWLEQVLALPGHAPSGARALAHRGCGLMAYAEGDYAAARAQTEEALRLARELDDKPLICGALNNLAIVLIDQADYQGARAYCEAGLAVARELVGAPYMGILLNNLGVGAVYSGDYAAAIPVLEESLAIASAERRFELMAWATGNLGNAAYYQGDLTTAAARYKQSLRLGVDVGDKRIIAERLEELAWVAAAESRFETAARVFGAAEALRETIGATMPPANRAAYDRALTSTAAHLGDALAPLWQAGRGLALEDAIAEALAVDASPAPGVTRSLSHREEEVARLVADGLSNREIAEALALSVRTVEAHVTHLLNKLTLRSRAQLAVWFVNQRD